MPRLEYGVAERLSGRLTSLRLLVVAGEAGVGLVEGAVLHADAAGGHLVELVRWSGRRSTWPGFRREGLSSSSKGFRSLIMRWSR